MDSTVFFNYDYGPLSESFTDASVCAGLFDKLSEENSQATCEYRRDATREENLKLYNPQLEELKAYFKQHNYHMALAALDLLEKEKGGKWRKDDVTPAIAHEIDQIMYIMAALKNATINPDEVKDEFLEQLFTGALLHDIGEDYGYWYQAIVKALTEGVEQRCNGCLPGKYETLIPDTAQDIEILTHYRKFSSAGIQKLFGFDVPIPETDCPIRLTELEKLCKPLLDASGQPTDNMQAFVTMKTLHDGTKEAVVIIGRHGLYGQIGMDWDSYGNEINDNLRTKILKRGDRCHGMGARPSLAKTPAGVENYRRYLENSRVVFSDTRTRGEIAIENSTPFGRFFQSIDSTMGVLDKIGGLFLRYNLLHVKPGSVANDAFNLRKLDFCRYMPEALEVFRGIKAHNHPIVQILQQIAEQIPEQEKARPYRKDGVSASEHFLQHIMGQLIRTDGQDMLDLLVESKLLLPSRYRDMVRRGVIAEDVFPHPTCPA